MKEIAYCGHIITEKGVAMDNHKNVTMTSWPVPNNLKALRGFFGLTDIIGSP